MFRAACFCVASALLLFLWCVPVAAQPDLQVCSAPGTLISTSTSPVVDTITVTDDQPIAAVHIFADIAHTWIGDLALQITSPAMTSVTLKEQGGGDFDDILVTFDDQGMPFDIAQLSGGNHMQPQGPGALADFTGQSTLGDWSFTVEDLDAGNSGTLDEWCLRSYQSVPPAPPAPVTGLTCGLDPATGVASLAWQNSTPNDSINIYVNGILDGTVGGTETSYDTTPQPIPSALEICVEPVAGGFTSASTCCRTWSLLPPDVEVCLTPGMPLGNLWSPAISVIDVSGSLLVSDLQVQVEITTSFVGGVEIELTSPDSISVRLQQVYLDPSANLDLTYWDQGFPNAPPFDCACPMQPSGPGSLSDFFGLELAGRWTLTAGIDNYGGTLEEWCLRAYESGAPMPISALTCEPSVAAPGAAVVSWTNNAIYDEINIYVNGALQATISGTETSHVTQPLPLASPTEICVEAVAGGDPTPQRCCTVDFLGPVQHLVCSTVPGSGIAQVSWRNQGPYDAIKVYAGGILEASLPGDAESATLPPQPLLSTVEICVEGELAGVGPTEQACCRLTLLPPPVGADTIFAGEYSGLIDSVGALASALETNGRDVTVVSSLDGATAGTPARLWVCLGTYPQNHALTHEEGSLLSSLAASAIPIYIEGGDIWGFDAATPFHRFDGVLDSPVSDVLDLTLLTGIDSGVGLDLTGMDGSYNQDQPGSDWNDWLIPCTASPDLGGPDSAPIWSTDSYGSIYYVGLFYDSVFAPVISQSFEFGGYAGDQVALAGLYLGALGPGQAGPAFFRGDANGNGAIDLSDAIFLLAALLIPGAPQPSCADAIDINDDGLMEVDDAIFLLSSLFLPGTPPPLPPFPDCGEDLSTDLLGCTAFPGCP